MRLFSALVISALLMVLAAACTAPPPTEEQLEAYNRYAQLRATDAAASEMIAAAKATEAAAAQQLAQLTAEAAPATEAIAATVTPTSTQIITATTPLTGVIEAATATGLLTTTVAITATAEATPELASTAPVTPTTSARAVATIEITATATLTPTVAATATLTPTVAATATLTPTVAATATRTPTIAATATRTPTIAATATRTPTIAATATVAPAATPQAAVTVAFTPTATVVANATPTPLAPSGSAALWRALAAEVSPGQVLTATLAAPTPTPPPAGQVTITSQQANLRGGPGMAFDVIATAQRGDTLDVYGGDAAQNWWQVCCVDGKPGWVSRTIVRLQGDAEAVPVVGPLLPDDLQASWAMRWECHGRGCKQETCTGQSQAKALRVASDRWLEVQRDATWDDECGEPEDWLNQVDRYAGRERASTANAPLFKIWEGANPGPANRVVDLAGAPLALWCTGTRTQEVEQAGGWTAAFEGQACYDTKSGILALMQYVKRWLFTGTASGQTFDREYFGDYEVIQQVLLDTNAPLSGR